MIKVLGVKELLEWAYAVERVAASGGASGLLEAERQAAGLGRAARSMTGALADQAALGARVSGGGGLGLCHEDADTIDHVVRRMLTPDERTLVIACAEAREVPDWRPAARHRLEPRRRYTGGKSWVPEVVTFVPGVAGRVPAYCPIVESDAPREVARLRAIYECWHVALSVVRARLLQPSLRLRDHRVSAALPPWRPWAT